MYGIAGDELNKRLLEKGSTLTRIDARTIGKAYENTKQEVLECCSKQPVKESIKLKLCLRRSQRKSLCVITVPIRRVARAFQTKNSALPGVQYAENAKSKIIFKIQRNVNVCKQRGKPIRQIANNKDH